MSFDYETVRFIAMLNRLSYKTDKSNPAAISWESFLAERHNEYFSECVDDIVYDNRYNIIHSAERFSDGRQKIVLYEDQFPEIANMKYVMPPDEEAFGCIIVTLKNGQHIKIDHGTWY